MSDQDKLKAANDRSHLLAVRELENDRELAAAQLEFDEAAKRLQRAKLAKSEDRLQRTQVDGEIAALMSRWSCWSLRSSSANLVSSAASFVLTSPIPPSPPPDEASAARATCGWSAGEDLAQFCNISRWIDNKSRRSVRTRIKVRNATSASCAA